jgi:hypothetical protein
MKKNQQTNLQIKRGRVVRDEHGLTVEHEQVLAPLAGSERAVRASVIKSARLQQVEAAKALEEATLLRELEAANALNQAAPARRIRNRRRTKPPSADV